VTFHFFVIFLENKIMKIYKNILHKENILHKVNYILYIIYYILYIIYYKCFFIFFFFFNTFLNMMKRIALISFILDRV